MRNDWADKDADKLLSLLEFTHTWADRRELIAAKLREVESAGVVRGARVIAEGVGAIAAGVQP